MEKINVLLYLSFNFFVYGIIGWVIENIYCYLCNGYFQKDGFLHLPFKPMYAIAMSLLVLINDSTAYNKYILISICFVVPTLIEYITGVIMKIYFNKDYWDYSKLKFNIQGIICLKFSIYWTVLTYIGVQYFQTNIIDRLYLNLGYYWQVLCPIIFIILVIDDLLSIKKFNLKVDI